VRALEDDCRHQRRLIDHWAYDLPLHMQLYSRLKSARATLALMERGIPTPISTFPDFIRQRAVGGHPDEAARREHGTYWGRP
jgi:hypothetical protein